MKLVVTLLILTAFGVAGFFWTQRRGPTLSPLEVGWTADGFHLAFTRQPPGPAALRLAAPSGDRTTPTTSSDGVHHTLDLRGLVSGQRITATPLAGDRTGPPVVLTSHGSAVSEYDEKDGADGALRVTFRTATPVRCRLQVQSAAGPVWLDWERAPASDHQLDIPPAHAPALGALAIELQSGDDTRSEPVAPTPRLRTARRLRLAGELLASAGRLLIATKRNLASKLEEGSIPAPSSVLPVLPAWLADELAGPGGALDDLDLPPRRKDELYRTILDLGDADRQNPPAKRAGWHLLPRGRDFGVSAQPHYPKAIRLPLAECDRNLNAPILLLNKYAMKTASKEDLFATGEVKSPGELSGEFELERIGPHTRVEIFIRARLPLGRVLEATVNTLYRVRLNAPESADGQVHDFYAAFDPAYLVEGWNEIRLADALLPTDPSPEARTILEPPGLEVRFSP